MLKKILGIIAATLLIAVATSAFLLTTGALKIYFEPGANKEIVKNLDRDFRRISMDFPADFTIKASNENKIVINGGQNVLEFLNITQTSRTLGFSLIESDWLFHPGWSMSGNNRLNIVIHTTKVEELIATGDSKVVIQKVDTDSFDLDFSGKQSVIIAQLVTNKAVIKASGSGFVDISGKTDTLDLNSSSTGRILLRNFEAKNATIQGNSIGTTEVYVTERLSAEITSSGLIRYRGSPEINKKLTGSGDLVRL